MFMPIARVFSLDSLLQKIKFSTIYKKYELDNKILQVNYLFVVFVGIGLVYIDSVFHKLSSKLWMDGLGVWLPSNLLMITCNDTSFLLNQKRLVIFLEYLVLVFEATLIFLFWFKKWRIPLLFLGVFFITSFIGGNLAYYILIIGITILMGYFSYKYIELYFVKLKHKVLSIVSGNL
jgi:hypothetical protein